MIALYRVDDRLVHGQVVLGWGQSLQAAFIVLVDNAVAASQWEQELYQMGVPPEMELYFADVAEAERSHDAWVADRRPGILLAPDLATMERLLTRVPAIRSINLGGVHHRPGRVQRLRYVYLTELEEELLRRLEQRGVHVTAQDVPTARPVPLSELLSEKGSP
ncbi:MAG TPA: PTS sugar transporter subunit IIB [Gemmatimonadaceae bacterium]|nr:PTS sugar transporter subunit IIB [Gemmatimonadaceae bacterium]